MPGFILHLGATVQCSHAGQAIPTVTSSRVLVGGQPVAILGPYTIAGCTFPPPPAGNGYDGFYYVKSVTSTLKRGEFKQTFSLVRDGLISLTPTVPT